MLAPIDGTVGKFPVYQHYGRPWSEIRERRDARDEAKQVTSLLSDALPPRLPKSRFTCRGTVNQERAYETCGIMITFCFVKDSESAVLLQQTMCNFYFYFLSSMFPGFQRKMQLYVSRTMFEVIVSTDEDRWRMTYFSRFPIIIL
jgi:hypothetical protein